MNSSALSRLCLAGGIGCLVFLGALVSNIRIQGMSGAEAVYEYLHQQESGSFTPEQFEKISAAVRWSHDHYSDLENDERLVLYSSMAFTAFSALFFTLSTHLRHQKEESNQQPQTRSEDGPV